MAENEASVIDEDERAEILKSVIADYARDGWTITGVFAGQAIAQKKERLGSNNFWVGGIFWTIVVLLVVFTAGLWLIVIVIWYLTLTNETVIIKVDEFGQVEIS